MPKMVVEKQKWKIRLRNQKSWKYLESKLSVIITFLLAGAAVMDLFVATLRFILGLVYKTWDIIGTIYLIFTFDWLKSKKYILPIGSRKILLESVTGIAEKIRTQQVTAEEVMLTFIDRIREVNPAINSVVDDRFVQALELARKEDKLIQSRFYKIEEMEEKLPLLGVPFTIKDAFGVKGLRHTVGLYARRNIHAVEHSEVVWMLRKGGAIPIGVTNVSELCMWWESFNTIYGVSSNPYDTRHTTGGSSGGEAGLQAAAGSAFGIGSDVGGSIRLPAFFCGVFGLKPTSGLVSSIGQEPRVTGRIKDFVSVGPICRHSKDMKLLLRIMAQEEELKKLKPAISLKKIRIFYMEDDGGSPLVTPVSDELKAVMAKAVRYLEQTIGIKAQKVSIKKMIHSLEVWESAMSRSGATTFCEELGMRQRKVNPFWELLKLPFGLSHHTFPALALGMAEKLAYAANYFPASKEMLQTERNLSSELESLLLEDGVFLYPSHPTTAPRHGRPKFRPFDFSYGAIFNILGLPVVQVPLGLNGKGLPVGIQVAAGRYNDFLLIKLAEEFENGFGGWVPP